MNSWRPFLWLHGRRLWYSALYWLRSLAIIDDTRTGALGFAYTLYSAAIFGAAIFLAWGAMLSIALNAGATLLVQLRGPILSAVLVTGVHLLIALLLGIRLLTPGWQVSAPDLAYTTVSPQRAAPLFLSFVPRLIVAVALALPVGAFIVVVLRDSLQHYGGALIVLTLVLAISYTASWALGLVRLMTLNRFARAALWLVPVGVLVLGGWISRSPLDPGSMLLQVADRGLAHVNLPLLGIAIVVALGLLWAAGEHVDMTLLAEASTRRAERQALSSLARFDPALAAQLRRQAAFRTRRSRGHLPEVYGDRALVARVAIGRIRHLGALWGVVRAVGVLVTGCSVILNPQGLVWLSWLFILMIVPPTTLVEEYEQDMHPFMRQFMPQRRTTVLALDALVPGAAVLMLGVALVLLLHIGADPLLSALLLAALVVVSVLTQSMRTALSARTILPIADIIATLVSFGLILLFARSGVLADVAVAACVSAVLGALVSQSDGPSGVYRPPAPVPDEDDDIA